MPYAINEVVIKSLIKEINEGKKIGEADSKLVMEELLDSKSDIRSKKIEGRGILIRHILENYLAIFAAKIDASTIKFITSLDPSLKQYFKDLNQHIKDNNKDFFYKALKQGNFDFANTLLETGVKITSVSKEEAQNLLMAMNKGLDSFRASRVLNPDFVNVVKFLLNSDVFRIFPSEEKQFLKKFLEALAPKSPFENLSSDLLPDLLYPILVRLSLNQSPLLIGELADLDLQLARIASYPERKKLVNKQGLDGNTLIYHAISNQNFVLAELLIANGADYKLPNLDFTKFIKWSKEHNRLPFLIKNTYSQTAEFLLPHLDSKDINTKDSDGHTALDYALSRNHFELVKSLIDIGADTAQGDIAKILNDEAFDQRKLASFKKFAESQQPFLLPFDDKTFALSLSKDNKTQTFLSKLREALQSEDQQQNHASDKNPLASASNSGPFLIPFEERIDLDSALEQNKFEIAVNLINEGHDTTQGDITKILNGETFDQRKLGSFINFVAWSKERGAINKLEKLEPFLLPYEEVAFEGHSKAQTFLLKLQTALEDQRQNSAPSATKSDQSFLLPYDSDDEEIAEEEAGERGPSVPGAPLSLTTSTKESEEQASTSFQPLENEKLSKEERTKDPSK